MKIGNHTLGIDHPTFVIAEIGVNHDGSVHKALQLVETAARCGANAVKLQLFRGNRLMHPTSQLAGYQAARAKDVSPAAMLQKYELSDADTRRVVTAIRERGLTPIATPFSLEDVELARALDLPATKIASPDLVNLPLLQRCAEINRPILVSTGAATMEEVSGSVEYLKGIKAKFGLLHCVSSYPTPPEDAQLSWIWELTQFDVPVGYSDHTTEIVTGALAVAAGATVIERHLTLDRTAVGPDHAASSDPKQFAAYVQAIRQAETLRGRPGKCVLESEREVRKVSRQSLVARRELKVGEMVRETDLAIQRPGTGIPAGEFGQAVGRRVIRPVPAGALLQWDMLDRAA